jgi:hypothetical protein
MAAAVTAAAPNPVVDTLIRARALIAPDGRWTQGAFARDADGRATIQYSNRACCWCVAGAISAVAQTSDDWSAARDALSLVIPGGGLITWADDPKRTHAEVLAGFDRAIERAKDTGGQP